MALEALDVSESNLKKRTEELSQLSGGVAPTGSGNAEKENELRQELRELNETLEGIREEAREAKREAAEHGKEVTRLQTALSEQSSSKSSQMESHALQEEFSRKEKAWSLKGTESAP